MPWRLCLYMAAPTRYYSTSAHAHDVQGLQQCMYMSAWTEVYGSSLYLGFGGGALIVCVCVCVCVNNYKFEFGILLPFSI